MSCYSEKAVILQSDNYHHKYDIWKLDLFTAISPIDGRYRGKRCFGCLFSEFALIKYRVQVEIEYFITLVSCLCRN